MLRQRRIHLNKFQATGGKTHHPQQKPAMTPAVDVRFPVGPRAIANGQIHQPQIELGGPEDQIEIAEWIKVPEISAVASKRLVICAEQDFGAAKSVFDFL